MTTQLNIEYSTYWIILCFIVGVFYAGIFYWRTSNDISKKLKVTLAFLRFITVFLLSFFLLEPYVKSENEKYIDQKVVFLIDNSESVGLSSSMGEIKKLVKDLTELDENEVKVDYFPFDKALKEQSDSLSFDGKETNLSNSIQELVNKYQNRNLKEINVLTDGIINSGKTQIKLNNNDVALNFFALGDTTVKRDAKINRLFNNKVTYLGNKFPVEFEVNLINLENEKIKIELFYDDTLRKEWNILPNSSNFFSSYNHVITANNAGVKKIEVKIKPVDGEITAINNVKSSFIKVVSEKKRMLVLYENVHPDIAAFKSVFYKNEAYEMETVSFEEADYSKLNYDLLVCFSMPSKKELFRKLESLIAGGETNVLLFFEADTKYNYFQKLLVKGYGGNVSLDASSAIFSKDFNLFQITKDIELLKEAPPLDVPYGIPGVRGEHDVLINQKIGSVETDKKLLYFSKIGSKRIGVVNGEGIWKWRIFANKNESQAFNQLISKTVALLSVPIEKNKLKLMHKQEFKEGESVVINAEFRNNTNEVDNSHDLNLILIDDQEKEYAYVFSKVGDGYRLNINELQPGVYSLKVYLSELKISSTSKIIITKSGLETMNLQANHTLLKKIANENGGGVYSIEQASDYLSKIGDRDFKKLSLSINEYKELIKEKWILILLILLLGTEWVVRKIEGQV